MNIVGHERVADRELRVILDGRKHPTREFTLSRASFVYSGRERMSTGAIVAVSDFDFVNQYPFVSLRH